MTDRSARHASFVITREFAAPPSLVFSAWTSNTHKEHWFTGPQGWKEMRRELDFRVGGSERLVGRHQSGRVTDFDAYYSDILTDKRLVYTYTMRLDEVPISVSLATVEFAPCAKGTRMTFTEQAVFIDAYDDPGAKDRKTGTAIHLDRIAAYLESALAQS